MKFSTISGNSPAPTPLKNLKKGLYRSTGYTAEHFIIVTGPIYLLENNTWAGIHYVNEDGKITSFDTSHCIDKHTLIPCAAGTSITFTQE